MRRASLGASILSAVCISCWRCCSVTYARCWMRLISSTTRILAICVTAGEGLRWLRGELSNAARDGEFCINASRTASERWMSSAGISSSGLYCVLIGENRSSWSAVSVSVSVFSSSPAMPTLSAVGTVEGGVEARGAAIGGILSTAMAPPKPPKPPNPPAWLVSVTVRPALEPRRRDEVSPEDGVVVPASALPSRLLSGRSFPAERFREPTRWTGAGLPFASGPGPNFGPPAASNLMVAFGGTRIDLPPFGFVLFTSIIFPRGSCSIRPCKWLVSYLLRLQILHGAWSALFNETVRRGQLQSALLICWAGAWISEVVIASTSVTVASVFLHPLKQTRADTLLKQHSFLLQILCSIVWTRTRWGKSW